MPTRTKKRRPKAAHPAPIAGAGVLGIDPGISGGIAWIPDVGPAWGIRMIVMEGDDGRACLDLPAIAAIFRYLHPSYAVIERVTAGRKDRLGGDGATRVQGATGMFSFGRNVGELMGILATLGIPVAKVTPQAWKRAVLGPVVDREAERANPKARAIQFVAKNYPGVRLVPPRCRRPHDGIADSVCLAHLAREMVREMVREIVGENGRS